MGRHEPEQADFIFAKSFIQPASSKVSRLRAASEKDVFKALPIGPAWVLAQAELNAAKDKVAKSSDGISSKEAQERADLKNTRLSSEIQILNSSVDETKKTVRIENSLFEHNVGGWTGYEKSRPPGPITMKGGLQVLKSIQAGWALKNV